MSGIDSPEQEVEGADVAAEEYAQEERAPDLEPEVEYSPEQLYVQERLKALELDGSEESAEAEEPAEESEPEQEAAAEEQEEAEPEPPKEGLSKAARRHLAKEKKLRAEKEALRHEQEQWKSEREETLAKIEAFERSRQEAYIDPIAHLEQLGFKEEDILNTAREVYYRFMPDNASPQVRAEMAAIQQDRRQKKLELSQQEIDKQLKEQNAAAQAQAYEANYRQALTHTAATIDTGKFPLAAEYAKEDFNDLVQGMFNAAVVNAQSGATVDLTPEECLGRVESYLRETQPQRQPEPQKQIEEPDPEPVRKKRVIKNKTSASRPNEKHDDNLSYEELRERSRERFYSKLREKDMIQD
jgi:hypothetical protein